MVAISRMAPTQQVVFAAHFFDIEHQAVKAMRVGTAMPRASVLIFPRFPAF